MKFREEKDEECQLQMGPMMDCTFLLLLYFLASSQIKIEEKYLGLLVPGNAPTKVESLPAELTIAINENGQVFCNEMPVGGADDRLLPLLQGKLKQCIDLFGDKQPVVIHPQPKVRQQRIVDVLAACAAAGVKNLSFFANQ
ncbi:MAG: biopolymer transporter ExbD [Lentisphaerae bacterium]|nr:biopolymer transporter ExbD [Lentisphaerota bacterium]